jgi:hypothetical protein
MMKHCLTILCAVALAVVAAWAQQKKSVPPPPKPADDGPSLEVTIKFIQDRLSEQGQLFYSVRGHDTQSGQDTAPIQYSFQATSFTFDPGDCRFERHYNLGYQLPAANWVTNNDNWLSGVLQSIKQVQVTSAIDWWTQELAAEGHPAQTARVQPPFFVLSFGRAQKASGYCTSNSKPDGPRIECPDPNQSDRLRMTWGFRDEDTANRVAKAMVHAAELCGGGQPEPF